MIFALQPPHIVSGHSPSPFRRGPAGQLQTGWGFVPGWCLLVLEAGLRDESINPATPYAPRLAVATLTSTGVRCLHAPAATRRPGWSCRSCSLAWEMAVGNAAKPCTRGVDGRTLSAASFYDFFQPSPRWQAGADDGEAVVEPVEHRGIAGLLGSQHVSKSCQ